MPKKNEPSCKLCFDKGCEACLDEMPECPVCNTNKYVDTIAPDQSVFCCVHCGSEFIEKFDDEGEGDESALEAYWDRLAAGTEKNTIERTEKPEFGKVIDDTDPDSPKVV